VQHNLLKVQAGYVYPDYDIKATHMNSIPSPLWPAEASQFCGRATSSAATATPTAPRRNATAFRMVSNGGVAYQYAAPAMSIAQPQSERREICGQQVGVMRSSEYERIISPTAQLMSPQLERRVEGINSIGGPTITTLM
jgi:hypothetical protein